MRTMHDYFMQKPHRAHCYSQFSYRLHCYMPDNLHIAQNIQQIQQKIADAEQKYQRQKNSVCLLAVSKTKPADMLRAAFAAGQRDFGENYTQEALQKITALNDLAIVWHFIGAIQSNKSRDIAEHFAWVHSVDRLKIARRLSEQRPTHLAPLNICLQVNISEEGSKSGFLLDELDDAIEEIVKLPHINLRGLMAIPAKASTLTEQRAIFSPLKKKLHDLNQQAYHLDTLSMGMSNDMAAAIAEGATIVRIGTAIFGTRHNASSN